MPSAGMQLDVALARSMKGKMEPEQRQALIEEGKKIKEDRPQALFKRCLS